MKNSEIIEELENKTTTSQIEEIEEEEELIKFVVFFIDEKKYAIHAADVREIVINNELYFVPFVPSYVRGFINRHGEPYTVLDMRVLFENETLDSKKYLILNLNQDQCALIISDILEIITLEKSEIHSITSSVEENAYFSGSITVHEEEILILEIDKFIERLQNDI